MNADPRSAPRDGARLPHRGLALALAVIVHLAFLAVLIFSIRWQNHAPEPVTAELYAPIAQPPKSAPPPPKIEPAPTPPKPVPVPPPKATPAPPPKPVVEPEKPDNHDAEIALKARSDAERRKRVDAELRAQAEQQKRVADLQHQRELQKQLDDKKAADAKKATDVRERQERAMTQMREQVEKEMQQRANAETAQRAQAARKSAESDYISRIQAKIKGNVILPPDLAGNPQAEFDVVQLPTGEIIDVRLKKSSGAKSYDDAVQRAILKSSPLPKPERADMFERVLNLRFRPND